jgi:hypothetical protein
LLERLRKQEHRDRRPAAGLPPPVRRLRQRRSRRPDPERAHRAVHAFQPAFAQVLERQAEAVGHLVAHGGRDDRLARAGQRHQPRGQVDAIAIQVELVGQHVGEVDADPQVQLFAGLDTGVALLDPRLERERAIDGTRGAVELDQHAVAQQLDDAALVRRQFVMGDLGDERAPARHRAVRIKPDFLDRVDDIGKEHRAQPTGSLRKRRRLRGREFHLHGRKYPQALRGRQLCIVDFKAVMLNTGTGWAIPFSVASPAARPAPPPRSGSRSSG